MVGPTPISEMIKKKKIDQGSLCLPLVLIQHEAHSLNSIIQGSVANITIKSKIYIVHVHTYY